MDLNQATCRMHGDGGKYLYNYINFNIEKKPQTTAYVLHICSAYFIIKSLWKNCIDYFEEDLEL